MVNFSNSGFFDQYIKPSTDPWQSLKCKFAFVSQLANERRKSIPSILHMRSGQNNTFSTVVTFSFLGGGQATLIEIVPILKRGKVCQTKRVLETEYS